MPTVVHAQQNRITYNASDIKEKKSLEGLCFKYIKTIELSGSQLTRSLYSVSLYPQNTAWLVLWGKCSGVLCLFGIAIAMMENVLHGSEISVDKNVIFKGQKLASGLVSIYFCPPLPTYQVLFPIQNFGYLFVVIVVVIQSEQIC